MAQDILEAEEEASTPPPRRPTRRGRLIRCVVAVASGLALAAAFPPIGAWPVAPLAVAGLLLAVRGVPVPFGAVLGFLAGFGFFAALLQWLRVIGVDGWLVLSAFQAGYVALMGGALAAVTRLPGWPLWGAALWVAEEAVRGRFPLGGFTWGRLAFSQADSAFTNYAALGGAPLATFATALAGGMLAWALVSARRRRAVTAAGLAGALAVPAAGLAIPTSTTGRDVTVAAVQGNVPRVGLDFLGEPWTVLTNHVDQTHRLAEMVRAGRVPEPDMVVWPENASDIDPYRTSGARAIIGEAVRAVQAPVLVGALRLYPENRTRENIGIPWYPGTGPGPYYVKRHPVPFGEYVPFRDLLAPVIDRFEMVSLDMVKGDEPGVMQLGPVRIGDVICFEVAYDDLVRDVVDRGAQVLVVQTNNATFGMSGQPEQQLAISRLRAVEHGRAVVIAATSGISAIVAPDGRLLDVSEKFTADLLVETLPSRDGTTVADVVGTGPELVLTLIGIAGVVAAGLRPGRRRRSADRS